MSAEVKKKLVAKGLGSATIDKAAAAGFSLATLLALLEQYGPTALAIIEQLLASFNPPAPVPPTPAPAKP